MKTLDQILTPQLAQWLSQPPPHAGIMDYEQLERRLEHWSERGARLRTLGYSRAGRAIRSASIGSGFRSMLAWGYPHPDEPLGARALVWLGDALLDGHLSDLNDWTVHLVLCADPDGALLNSHWLSDKGPATARRYVQGCWHPQQLGDEVDLGFETSAAPFGELPIGAEAQLTRCPSRSRCACPGKRCQRRHLPFPPLPESSALHEALTVFRPELVASMHGISAGASYSFLVERPSGPRGAELMRDLTRIPEVIGTGRYLGEPLDRGRRMLADTPDLIRDPQFRDLLRMIERQPFYEEGERYYARLFASQVIQAELPGTQMLTPEVALFSHPSFSDDSPLERLEPVQVSVEERRRGRYRVTRVKDHSTDCWIVAHQDRTADPVHPPVSGQAPLTRGMLGVQALARKRESLRRGDEIWSLVRDLPGHRYHPYEDERWALRVPGAYVNDRSMLIFRMREDYRRTPTVAQEAAFAWFWPLHTASLLGGLHGYLRAQAPDMPLYTEMLRRVERIQDELLAGLPESLLSSGPVGPALSCALGRVLRLMVGQAMTG